MWGNSSSDVFAVGDSGTILHYDGSSWSGMTSATTDYLEAVWGSSATNVFAVGHYGMILHYNDTPPAAGFSASPTSGNAPLEVDFTDLSTGGITSWEWDFDNNSVVDSTAQNPTHTYTASGTYTVSLTVSGPGGSDTETKTGYISAAVAITPSLTHVGIGVLAALFLGLLIWRIGRRRPAEA